MKTLMIDIMLNDRFYAAFRYKYCPAFKFDIEDMTNKVYERPHPAKKGYEWRKSSICILMI